MKKTQNKMPHQFTISNLTIFKTKYRVCSLFKRGKGTYVKTLEVYTVTTLEVYTIKTLEVYTVKTLEVYTIKTLEVFCYQIFTGGDMIIIPNIELM